MIKISLQNDTISPEFAKFLSSGLMVSFCKEIFIMEQYFQVWSHGSQSSTGMQSYGLMGLLCGEIFLMILPHPLSLFRMHKQQYKTLLVDMILKCLCILCHLKIIFCIFGPSRRDCESFVSQEQFYTKKCDVF